EQALGAHPEDSDAHLMAGRLAFAEESYDDAARHFESVRLKNPFNPEIHSAFAKLYELQGEENEAALAKEFLELSRKPREQRRFEMPGPEAGEARLNVVTSSWKPVRIDSRLPTPSPAWDLGVAAGEHVIEYVDSAGKLTSKTVNLTAGESKTITLK
ncbi:MAG: tetratricopeptide repeat protein, partial [Myxococcota bacterium]